MHNYIKLVQLYGTIFNMHSSPMNVCATTFLVNDSCQRPCEAYAKQKHRGGGGWNSDNDRQLRPLTKTLVTPLAFTVYSMYLHLNLLTMPDLKF
jgi:hypothetical protein